MAKPFNVFEARMLRALTEALFHELDMAITARQVVDNLQHQFGLMRGGKPKEIGLALTAMWLALGPLFTFISPAARKRRIEERLLRTSIDFLQDLERLRGVVYAGYYGHWEGVTQDDNAANPVLRQIGFTLPAHRNRPDPPEVSIAPVPGRGLVAENFVPDDAIPESAEVIVIGSGAGGAVAAAQLAAHGHEVLIVEAGPHYPSSRITHEERRMTARLFADGGIQTTKDRDIVIFQGRCVGGSTVINNGICLRVKQVGNVHVLADDVFAKWAAIGAPIDVGRFNDSYAWIEQRLDIGPIEARAGRNNGPHLLNGWAAYAAASTDPGDAVAPAKWFSKNYGPASKGIPCAYCGYCNTGCPYGRKQGMAQSLLIDACKDGARILADARVTRIRWKEANGGGKRTADAVDIELADGRKRRIRATRGVVVAAGTIASSRILKASGIDRAGEGVSLNIASPMAALMPTEQRAWDEDQMATYVDRGDYLIESHFQPPMSMATLLPGWFGEHFDRMKAYNRLASAGVLFPADRRGRLEDGKLDFKLRLEDMQLLKRALGTLARVHFANGALEVYPPFARGGTLKPGDDVDGAIDGAIREADDVTLSSSHPHGGNAINEDPALGVVNTACRLHDADNVLVTDASTFPSCIRVNAQLTTMAMAHYATAKDPF